MAGSPTVFTTSPQEMTSAITSAPGKQHDAVPAGAPGHPSVDMARKMFEHLDSIHRLQSDIASQHQALENVDLGVEAHFKSKRTETSRGYSSYNLSDLSVALNGIHDLGVDDTHGRSSSSQKSE
ncbi:hypothetical protein PSHT_09402 [Puccinia striiformis]|uniref:Uncharacterized protein n=1 Tax=Puccinia striiformis TaxID=27350 RepID=A0A2S4VH02_9BASI|nr:hypothetical protein PSHT_09402 [Puccinia striiformis]